ncbi:N-ethylammeline chlorohydrolase, partial [Bacillus licheniformis]|uniref:amidohydrolase family protein n=1 Tax=Bacillus licheniformis TaxID=1402 RepID=UPI000FBB86C1
MIVINNVTVLPMDGKNDIIRNTDVYIHEDRIYKIGKLEKNVKVNRVIDGKNMIMMPGLVNAHTHIAMSLLRNYADDLPLHEWLNDKIWPIE